MMAVKFAIYTGMIVLHQHQCREVIGLSSDNSMARLDGVSELVPVVLLAPASMSDIAAERMIMAEREDEHEFFRRMRMTERRISRETAQMRLNEA